MRLQLHLATVAVVAAWVLVYSSDAAEDTEAVAALSDDEDNFLKEGPMDPSFAKLSAADRAMFDDAPIDPAYAKLSATDKKAVQSQSDESYFTGSMSAKETAFAATQGAQKEMFGLSDQDKRLAHDQSSSTRLDKEGQDTLKDLTTEESFSEEDLKDLAGVQKAASVKAQEIAHKLADLKQSSSAPRRTQQKSLESIKDGIDDQIYDEEESSMDLGEGAGTDVKNPDMQAKIKEAKASAKAQMDATNEQQVQEVKTYRETMKESVKKADEVSRQATKAASRMVPDAMSEFDEKDKERKAQVRKKTAEAKDAAENDYRRAEANNIAQKQNAEIKSTVKSNKERSYRSKNHMASDTLYGKKLSQIDFSKTKQDSIAEEFLVKAKAELQEKAQRIKDNRNTEIRHMKQKFDKMKSEIAERTESMKAKLENQARDRKQAAEKRYKEAKASGSKSSASANILHAQSTKQSEVLMSESRNMQGKADSFKDDITRTQMQFKASELARKQKIKMEFGKIEHEENKFELNAQQERGEIKEKKAVRDQASTEKGDLSEEEYRKRQMKWLETVKTNANKNCDDAKKESILRTRGSRIANGRLSRMSQDMLFMKQKVLEDIKAKGKKAFDLKEKASKHLKKIVTEQAAGLKKDSDKYDQDGVQDAALEYSKIAGPEKSEEERIKEATEKVKEAKTAADEHTDLWAKKQNVKTANTLKTTADGVCHKEQTKYENVKYRVRKRLGEASENDHKALMKGQFEDKKWALRKVTVMLGKGKSIDEAGEKKKVQLTQEEQHKELQLERDEKDKVNKDKEKVRKLEFKAQQMNGQASVTMKSGASSQSIKIQEGEKLMEVAEREYKAEVKGVKERLDEGTSKIVSEAQKEKNALVGNRIKAMENLQKSGGFNAKEKWEKRQKKSVEMRTKAEEEYKNMTEKATTHRDEYKAKMNAETKQNLDKMKIQLQEKKDAIDRRLAEAKVTLEKAIVTADQEEKEALAQEGGSRNAAEFAIQTKATVVLNGARASHQEAIKAAKDLFVKEVKGATDSQLKKIHEIKQTVISQFGVGTLEETMLDEATELLQISDAPAQVSNTQQTALAWAAVQVQTFMDRQAERIRKHAAYLMIST